MERPNDKEPLISARNIGVQRGKRWIVRYLDITVRRGEIVYMFGANGAGKSTCAKVVLGLVLPTEGTIERAPSLEIGYVPQRLTISPTLPLTLRRLMGLTGKFSEREIDDALEEVRLDRLENPPVNTLSGGEFQRAMLARTLLHQPNLLVLDEPDQGIDIAGAELLYNLIDDIRRDHHCGVLLISHNYEQAMEAGDDLVMLVPHEHD